MNTGIEGRDRDSRVFEHYSISLSNHASPELSGVGFNLYESLKISFFMKCNVYRCEPGRSVSTVTMLLAGLLDNQG